jgi:imidazolonepropionase-like amidohydrolase
MHGSANVIGGQGETIKLRYGQDQENLKFKGAKRTIKFALGKNPTRVHGIGREIQPRTRMAVEQVVRKVFDQAIEYKQKREAYLTARDGKRKAGAAEPIPVAEDLRLEVISDIIEGEIWVHCHSYRADEIHMLMRVFRDYGVKNYTFQHANEAFKVAPELAANGAHASVFSDWWAYKFEVYYSTAYNATILTKNGVVTSINSDDEQLIRMLNHEAAKTMRYGQLSEEEALKLITLNPAIQLGTDKYVGSLEVGKQADFGIWNAHPLSVYAQCEQTYVDGVKYFDMQEDPVDMRLTVNPDSEYGMYNYSEATRHADNCLRDVFYFFDGTEVAGHSHEHH